MGGVESCGWGSAVTRRLQKVLGLCGPSQSEKLGMEPGGAGVGLSSDRGLGVGASWALWAMLPWVMGHSEPPPFLYLALTPRLPTL